MGEGVQVNLKTAFLTEISWTNNSNFKLQCKHTYTWMRKSGLYSSICVIRLNIYNIVVVLPHNQTW